MAEVKRRVAYYYRGDVGNYYYGAGHPMKPVRMKLAHHLLLSYGLYRQLEVYRPHLATAEEMKEFHSSDYIDFLSRITPENMHEFAASMSKFGIGEFSDCPVFSGLYDYCRIHAGGIDW
ncbi:hypothetical protein FNF27_06699 [Cafeteria roenbergensis]|uniref:Histone deacetylase domain-containing protein n=1 Tax=Cafeteria roenbergensis TaxID=33653 RepID=A0A5A8DZS2_CAFRO|nr:hypothetical protein FNF27_06699 [Cafeteria roenbergensis]